MPRNRPADASAAQARVRRVNKDTSWLFELPSAASSGGRFTILVDPWLVDAEQIDFTPHFSLQRREPRSSIGASVGEVKELLEVENQLGNCNADETDKARGKREQPNGQPHSAAVEDPGPAGLDALLISHPFTDHAHPETLATVPKAAQEGEPRGISRLPVLTTQKALPTVRASLKSTASTPVQQILTLPTYSGPLAAAHPEYFRFDALTVPPLSALGAALPHDIRIAYLPTRESTLLNGPGWPELHGALVFAWRSVPGEPEDSSDGDDNGVPNGADYDILLYTPHGTAPSSVPAWVSCARRRTLVHCLDRQVMPFLLGGPVALGFKGRDAGAGYDGALALCSRRSLSPHVLLATHDEHKEAHGLVSWLLRRTDCPPAEAQRCVDEQWAREQEEHSDGDREHGRHIARTRIVSLEPGELLSL